MATSHFLKKGHKPTLLSAFVYSDMSFMVWVLLGSLAVHIARDLKLSGAQQYTMVAIPLPAGWYPDEHQGKALGIAGAASSGTVFAALFAPGLAEAYGWRNVLALAVIPLFLTLLVYLLLAKERGAPAAPHRPRPAPGVPG